MKLPRIHDRFRYGLERMMIRGPHYQLLLVAMFIGVISLLGGAVVRLAAGGFDSVGAATWWAFLRLTDPGYLGDDVGVLRRIVSTILTVLGYVIFLGALIAIMTRWLLDTMRRLESGLTPIAANNHIAIIGWTGRTAALAAELVASEERLKRFLQLRGARRLQIAILADEVGAELAQELKDRIGDDWNPNQITLRTGSSLRPDHLERIDFLNAAVVLIPAQDAPGASAEAVDSRTIKALLSIGSHPLVRAGRRPPLAVVEIRDARKVPIARQAYSGELEIVASDAMISRLVAQNVRHRGLSHIFNELLTHAQGAEVYIRDAGALAGKSIEEALGAFDRGVLLGVARPDGRSFRPILNPPPGFTISDGDRLVALAGSFAEAEPTPPDGRAPVVRGAPGAQRPEGEPTSQRLLVLGWSSKLPAILAEFASYTNERFIIDTVSTISAGERNRLTQRYGADLGSLTLRHLEADYNHLPELQALQPWTYDRIILVGSGRAASHEDADARTLQGYLLLQDIFADRPEKPPILVELLEPENLGLLAGRPGETIISPMILSHSLAQVALRRELRGVFEELFTVGGAEITFQPAERYAQPGRETTFRDLQEKAWAMGEIAVGVYKGGGALDHQRPELNPGRDTAWRFEPGDELITLVTYR